MLLPQSTERVPAALILGGSGATDRNGNQPTAHTDNLKALARGLYEQGIATLRIDKRGVAASTPAILSEAELKFDHYVADAAAWLDYLRGKLPIGPLFVIGHSEGALTATLAAQRASISGLVLMSAMGSPLGKVFRRQLIANQMPENLRSIAFDIIATLERGLPVLDVPQQLGGLFRPSVHPYLISMLALDPVAEFAKTTVPALLLQGTTDLQVTREDTEVLGAARSGADVLVIEGMNHVLKRATGDAEAQRTAYIDPDLPLAPELVPAIAEFVKKQAGRA